MANKDFIKGIIYGAVYTVAAALIVNSCGILYKRYVKKEPNFEAKEKAIYSLLKNEYTDDIDKNEMYDGMFTGMVYYTTDNYSRYMSADEFNSFKIKNEGSYAGIGCTMYIASDLKMTIRTVYENSPAQKAGIKSGDKILKVEDTEVTLENYQQAVDKVRGEKGTSVKITLLHPDGTSNEVSVTRDTVNVPTVASAMLDNKIGYIHISAFENITYDQYSEAYKALKADGMERLIIDLRDNGGGLVTTASSIADDIIPEGIITYTEDKHGKKDYIRSKSNEIDIPLVVLTNGNSASASELVSACVQDTGKGKIVGETTYGKGVVQTTFPLYDGSAVKLTTAKYYTPKGICIDGIGIKPDVEVKAADDFTVPEITTNKAACDLEKDTQLIKAIEVVSEMN